MCTFILYFHYFLKKNIVFGEILKVKCYFERANNHFKGNPLQIRLLVYVIVLLKHII